MKAPLLLVALSSLSTSAGGAPPRAAPDDFCDMVFRANPPLVVPGLGKWKRQADHA